MIEVCPCHNRAETSDQSETKMEEAMEKEMNGNRVTGSNRIIHEKKEILLVASLR